MVWVGIGVSVAEESNFALTVDEVQKIEIMLGEVEMKRNSGEVRDCEEVLGFEPGQAGIRRIEMDGKFSTVIK